MLIKNILILSLTLVFAALFISCDEVNSPREDSFLKEQNYSFETIDSDLSFLKEGGMEIEGADGVFSIGWNEIFRPFDIGTEIMGTAFAVAFGEDAGTFAHFHRIGIDMGSVFINYASNSVEMHKHSNERRGTAYTLFKKPFGRSKDVMEFIPNEEYTFEVTGSELFSAATFTLTSPDALMDITSHNHADEIDPAQNLTLTWAGGNIEGKVGIRLMAHFRGNHGQRGPKGHGGPKGPPPRSPMETIIFVILDTNTGEYTFTAEQVQQLLKNDGTHHIVAGISQMDLQEVEHEGKILHTAMRNGNSVMLKVK
ncbi:MAG: hypothetical protein HKM87_04535 [Ignavibacteriaceae bacterium]|nr:hypothetical protein [Ignavibacteriaceae bacterium]